MKYDIKYGSVIFKNTNFGDKGKGLFMKVVNWATEKLQRFNNRLDGEKTYFNSDHTEFVTVDEFGMTKLHSSVYKTGFRSQELENWIIRQGKPLITIMQPPKEFTEDQKKIIEYQISQMQGIPYAPCQAITGIFKSYSGVDIESIKLLRERGIFCSESTKKLSLLPDWVGVSPDDLIDDLLALGYSIVFCGESEKLI